MKIEAVSAGVERVELSRPYEIAFRTIDAVEMGIVEIAAEGGRVGRGCASPEAHVTGESIGDVRAVLSDLDWLVGRDVRHLRALIRELEARAPAAPAARAAIDVALFDLAGQAAELPLVELLGRAHDALPTSVTIGIKSVSETLEEAREYLGRGFWALKVKLGRSLEEDVERLVRLREVVSPEVAIRVDPNQGYGPADVLAFARKTRDLDIEFLEQPMAAADIAAARELPAEIRDALAADESLLSPRDALELLRPPRACGIFNIKLMKCGGVAPALRIADIAETAGISLMWGCMDESRISIAAALHAALASPSTRYLDLDGHLDLARDVAAGGFVIEDGMMRPSGGAGLGLSPG